MLFMKGDPGAPRCGFSKTTIGILTEYTDVKYSTFDILTDNEVRHLVTNEVRHLVTNHLQVRRFLLQLSLCFIF